VLDFQAVLETEEATGREGLTVLIEVKGAIDEQTACSVVTGNVKHTFEVTPSVQILKRGTLAAEFERSLKAPRFVDRRK
jgi:phenylacetate-CoA ligase